MSLKHLFIGHTIFMRQSNRVGLWQSKASHFSDLYIIQRSAVGQLSCLKKISSVTRFHLFSCRFGSFNRELYRVRLSQQCVWMNGFPLKGTCMCVRLPTISSIRVMYETSCTKIQVSEETGHKVTPFEKNLLIELFYCFHFALFMFSFEDSIWLFSFITFPVSVHPL